MARITRTVAGILIITTTIFAADGNRVSMPPTRADQPVITQMFN